MLRMSYESIDKFFTVSDAMNPLMTGMGVPENKIVKIHNPITINKKIKTSLKKKLGIDDKKVILYAGRLAEDKGVQNTINAMRNVDNSVFIIAGRKKGYYKELYKLVKVLNLQQKVIFVDFVDNDKLKEYYSIADLVVLVEEFYEPLSRMLLEAASYGIPIIANDIGGNSEIVNSETGILINNKDKLANAINSIFKDKKKYNSMGKNAQKLIKKEFSLEFIGKKLNEEYQ